MLSALDPASLKSSVRPHARPAELRQARSHRRDRRNAGSTTRRSSSRPPGVSNRMKGPCRRNRSRSPSVQSPERSPFGVTLRTVRTDVPRARWTPVERFPSTQSQFVGHEHDPPLCVVDGPPSDPSRSTPSAYAARVGSSGSGKVSIGVITRRYRPARNGDRCRVEAECLQSRTRPDCPFASARVEHRSPSPTRTTSTSRSTPRGASDLAPNLQVGGSFDTIRCRWV